MSIYIIVGRPGHGKSTYATAMATRWQAHYARRKMEPRQIVANFHMAIPGVQYIESWEQIRELQRSIVIIDEAPMWFGGHEARSNAKHMGFFTQHRKEGNSLIIIAQSWSSLDLTIRERTCEGVYEVRRLFGPTIWEEPSFIEKAFGWWSIVRRYDAAEYDLVTKRRCYSTELFRLDRWHGKFDTLAKIGRLDEGRNSQGAGLAASEVVTALRPGDGITTAAEYDLARLWSEYRQRKGAHKHRTALAPEVRAHLGDERVIGGFLEYCRGVDVDEMGVVRYQRSVDSSLDDVIASRLRLSGGIDHGGSGYSVDTGDSVPVFNRVGIGGEVRKGAA
jgi:SpoVK/Ycf46/Vps4 family AAA+-type ATPase